MGKILRLHEVREGIIGKFLSIIGSSLTIKPVNTISVELFLVVPIYHVKNHY